MDFRVAIISLVRARQAGEQRGFFAAIRRLDDEQPFVASYPILA